MKPFVIGLLLIGLVFGTNVFGDEAPLKLNRYEFSQVQMGTRFRISLYASDRATANEASSAAYAAVGRLNQALSDYDANSEVRRLCNRSGPVVVSQPLFDVLSASQRLATESNGAFDATVGPFVSLWRKARLSRTLPTNVQIDEHRRSVGFQLIKLNPKSREVELRSSGMRIDLGGIAKGYAADKALRAIGKFGIRSALIDAGGDIVCSDPPPNKKAWVVAVGKLDPKSTTDTRELIQLSNAAVATSGDQFQFVEIDGKRYSHIVDPKTGMGLTQRRNVTVVAKDGMSADGLASAISVMGKSGFKLLPEYSASALIVEVAPKAKIASPGFAAHRFELPTSEAK